MRKLIFLLLFAAAQCCAQNYVTLTASNIQSAPNVPLVSGTIVLQAVGTNQQAISYQVGGGGQQILAPTICPITNGAIAPSCLIANVLLTVPQNLCFNATVKNSAGQIVLGGRNSGYQCLQPIPNNNPWCTAGVCNFDNYPPNLPAAVLVINMPVPSIVTLGGIYSGDCAPGTVAIGYNNAGHVDCAAGGTGGAGVWGGITGTLSNQADLAAALALLAPLQSPGLLGTPTAPTPPINDNSVEISNTAWIRLQGFAPLASPALSGTPTAPTVATNDSSLSIATTAWVNAQGYSNGTGNVTGPVSSVVGNITLFNSTNGRVLQDAGFSFPLAPSHIGTLVAGQNGLAASATSDTTNAANIVSGLLLAARLPLPTATTLGGVKSFAAVAHQWINSISTTGTPSGSQLACADLSNAASSCSIDATNAGNISSGTLAIARLATLVAGQNGLAASAITDTTNASNIFSGTLASTRMSAVNLAASGNGGVTGLLPPANMGSGYSFSLLSGAPSFVAINPFATLTDASTVTWVIGNASLASAAVTIAGNRTLAITGPFNGGSYVLRIKQDAIGGRTLTLGSGCTWLVGSGGGGAITLTTTPNAVDILTFMYDGVTNNCYANFNKNFN